MNHPDLKHGVLSPVITPFDENLNPDTDKFIAQCRWLIENNVGLAIFGTNSEGNSMSTEEKIDLLEKLVEAGLPPERMMPGTGCCALPDTLALTKCAVELGCGGALMLPPFDGIVMAEDPEVKTLMKLKGLEPAFVHADELAQMFCRELFLGPAKQSWVMLARTFPTVKGTLIEAAQLEVS